MRDLFFQKRRHPKKYVVFLYSFSKTPPELVRFLSRIAQDNVDHCAFLRFEDPDEGLKALYLKGVSLVIIHPSFLEEERISMEYALECKRRSNAPLLFLTRRPQELIQAYQKIMYPYEGCDDYLTEPLDAWEVAQKIQYLTQKKSVDAKQFLVQAPAHVFRINYDLTRSVKLFDISMVGMSMEWTHHEDPPLKPEEQLQIKVFLPYFDIYHPRQGEFARFSVKVKKVSLEGNKIGLSLEHLTSDQIQILMQIIQNAAQQETQAMIVASSPL